MTAPVELSLAPARRREGVGFDWQVVGVTVLPWVLFLTTWVLDVKPLPLAFAGAMLGTPHILATVGLYLEPGLRGVVRANRVAFWVVPLAVIAGSALAFAVSPRGLVYALLIGFVLWQTHHFTKQNFGLFTFWARSRGLPGASPAERKLIQATSVIGMAGILRVVDEGSWLDAAMRGVGLAAIVACGVGVLACTDDPRRRAALLVAVAFYAPLHIFDVGFLSAAFAYQAAHGAQYYLMVGKATRPTRRSLLAFLVFLVVAGLVLFTLVRTVDPYGSSAWALGLVKGLVAAHFIADSRFWRLRDKDIRTFMKSRFDFL
ncbi:MAG TPA: hypothetical protein VFU19_18910 [Iamia sp.]|nr:hypothetical protein [Iamia sp.]